MSDAFEQVARALPDKKTDARRDGADDDDFSLAPVPNLAALTTELSWYLQLSHLIGITLRIPALGARRPSKTPRDKLYSVVSLRSPTVDVVFVTSEMC